MLSLFSNDYKLNENGRNPVNTNIAHSNISIFRKSIKNVYTETFVNNKEKDLRMSNLMG